MLLAVDRDDAWRLRPGSTGVVFPLLLFKVKISSTVVHSIIDGNHFLLFSIKKDVSGEN